MSESIPAFTDVLSATAQGLPGLFVEGPLRAANTVITPVEPSTLALAIVGCAVVGIYLAARGSRRSKISPSESSRPPKPTVTARQSNQPGQRSNKRKAA